LVEKKYVKNVYRLRQLRPGDDGSTTKKNPRKKKNSIDQRARQFGSCPHQLTTNNGKCCKSETEYHPEKPGSSRQWKKKIFEKCS